MSNETLEQALETLLWCSIDVNGTPYDDYMGIDDIPAPLVKEIKTDLLNFIEQARPLLIKADLSDSDIGHDFILTSEGHGAGFWDRGLGDIGEQLTELCQPYGGYSDQLLGITEEELER